MQTLDIPLGHRIKIDKAIKAFKTSQNPNLNQSLQNVVIKEPSLPKENSSPRKQRNDFVKEHTKVQYEELTFENENVDKRV